jgi:hypothetical protein
MSANQGLTPNYSSAHYNTNGNLLGYQSVFVFYPTNGGYVTANISYNPSTGQVIYTPNVYDTLDPDAVDDQQCSPLLTELCFSTSWNLDGSQEWFTGECALANE